MPEQGDTRNDAGTVSASALQRIDDLERRLELMAARQRALMQVVAAGHGHLFREVEALLKAG